MLLTLVRFLYLMDSNMMILFMRESSILIPYRPVHVKATNYDVTDLNDDVIRVTVHEFELCAPYIFGPDTLKALHLVQNCTGIRW